MELIFQASLMLRSTVGEKRVCATINMAVSHQPAMNHGSNYQRDLKLILQIFPTQNYIPRMTILINQ